MLAPGGGGDASGGLGSLVISGGGSTKVATDELFAEAALMRELQRTAADWQCRLTRIRRLDDTPAPMWRTDDAGLGIFRAEQAAGAVAGHAGRLSDSLDTAAENYGEAERALDLLLRSTSALAAHTAGRFAPLLALLALPAASSTLMLWTALQWLFPAFGSGAAARSPTRGPGAWFREHPEILSDPMFVQAVRLLVSSADDAASGSLAVPFPVSFALGDEGLGVLGASASALGVVGLAQPVGGLRETRVTVRRTAVTHAPPPRGLADLAQRVPRASAGAPQVRVERYGTTRPVWVVYAGGTVDWSAAATGEPWDLTSNLALVAERDSGSYRAVEQAMREAGVRAGDPVVQVGHSQGGLVAARIAASADFNTVAVATFGAPAGQVAVPPEIPMIATEHSDDLVPALGGTPRDATGAGNQHLVVRREAFAGAAPPGGEAVPAHNLDAYEQTARLEDLSDEPRIVAFRENLAELVGDEPGEVTLWRGIRTTEAREEPPG
jgi:hypothetical protein